jgi:hypothetical protein
VRGPVSCIALADSYTPGLSVRPPTVPPATVVKGVALDATPYAAVADVCAASEDASAALVVPEAVPGGKPTTDVPGERLMSPVRTELPVLVIVVPATTASGVAAPRLIAAAANAGLLAKPTIVIALMAPTARALAARRTIAARGRSSGDEISDGTCPEIESGRFGAGTVPIRHTALKTELRSISTRLIIGLRVIKCTARLVFLHATLRRIPGSPELPNANFVDITGFVPKRARRVSGARNALHEDL